MRLLKDIHKQILWFAIVLILLFCAFSFFSVTVVSAQEDSFDDFDAFSSSLMEMIEQYDNEEDEGVAAQASTYSSRSLDEEEEEKSQIKRLIVKAPQKIDDCGAVAKAEYKDLHIFQYENAADAEDAFDFFCNCNISVSYDAVTTIEDVKTEDVTIESAYTTYPWANKSFNSWGATHVGYKNYMSTMFRANGGQLNDVIIAVLDSGINTSHTLLKDRIYHDEAQDFTGEISNTIYDYEDLNNHGSHVSGVIAEATLDNVKILPLKVLKGNGKGSVSMILAALEHVKKLKTAGLNIPALNLSVGVESENGQPVKNSLLESAIVEVYNCGVMPVVSAGNSSQDTSYACPANVQQSVTVSALAMGATGVYFDSSYSNYGSYVDFSAPGTSIVSAGKGSANSYVSMSGTSMAAPHVTAAVALLCSNPWYKDCTTTEIYDLLKENAVDCGSAGWDKYYGHGCVDMSEIGVRCLGDISYSATQEFYTSGQKIDLSLNYDMFPGDVQIYYTKSEDADIVDSMTGILYEGPIEITQTTKITAVAYTSDVYVNGAKSYITQSRISSKIYYFDNIDLLSNYEFTSTYMGYKISKYNGKLTTLNVPETYQGLRVTSVGANAFNSANVQVLNLPRYINQIDQSAFESNSKLQEIHLQSSGSVQIGAYAFYRCSNLSVFDIPKVSRVENYAFAYCQNLKSVEMYNVEAVGNHAFSASGVNEIFFGKNVSSIGNHTSLNLQTVYGFAGTEENSVSQQFAYDQNADFYDLTLRFTKDFNDKLIVLKNTPFTFQVAFVGVNADYQPLQRGFVGQVTGDGLEKTLTISSSGLSVGSHQLYVSIFDDFTSVPVRSNVVQIDVVNDMTETFSINFNEENFDVFVNNRKLEKSELFYKNEEYLLTIKPKDGYVLSGVNINEKIQPYQPLLCEVVVASGSENLQVEVKTTPKKELSVNFDAGGNGSVLVNGNVVLMKDVDRGNDITFSLQPNQGHVVRRVTANGVSLAANSDGTYTIKNIVSDTNVQVTFALQYNQIRVVHGKGGTISALGGESQLAYGESKTYTISPYDGYVVDFVSVNGERIEVSGNTFQVKNLNSNSLDEISVVVSFKKADDSLLSNSSNNVVMVYFFIFLSLFIIFVVARLVLYFVRKKSKRLKHKIY